MVAEQFQAQAGLNVHCAFMQCVTRHAFARRYAKVLQETHDEEHLTKFEELLEAAIDLDRIPDEYLVCASYDPGLEVRPVQPAAFI